MRTTQPEPLPERETRTRYVLEVQEDTIILRPDKLTAPKVTTMQDLDDLASRVGKAWQSEQSAVEILWAMRH